MATIIDSLLITLGLDPSGVKKGAKETGEALKKTENDATRTGKEMEARGKQAANFFGNIKKEAALMFGTFATASGLKSFIEDVTAGDAAASRLAKNIGMSTSDLTAWQSVAARAGGSAAGVAGSLKAMSEQVAQVALKGAPAGDVLNSLGQAGINATRYFDKATTNAQRMMMAADAFKGMDPRKAQMLGKGMVFDEGTINMLMQGGSAIAGLLAEQEKLGHANAADGAAAEKRQASYRAMSQAIEDAGRKLLNMLTPAIEAVGAAFGVLAEHQDLIQAGIIGIGAAALIVFAPMIAAAAAAVAPFLMIAAAVAAVVAAVFLLKDVFAPVLSLFSAVFGDIVNEVNGAAKLIYAILFGTSDDIRGAWKGLTGAMGKYFTDLVGLLKNLGPAIFDAITGAFGKAFDWITGRAAAVWEAITGKKSKPATGAPAPQAQAPQAPAAQAQPVPSGRGSAPRAPAPPAPAPQAPATQPHAPAPQAQAPAAQAQASPASPAAQAKYIGKGGTANADIAQFMGLGWTKEQATGLAANIQRESGGNHKMSGDNGAAYGLAQWHPDRQANFAKFAGKDIRQSTHEEQVDFMNHELRNGTERPAGRALSGAKTAAEAAAIVSSRYERPKFTAEEAQKRAAMAVAMSGGPRPDASLRAGAGAAVASRASAGGNTNTNSSEVHIAAINVQTQATDARGIARDIAPELRNQSLALQANTGLS